MHVYYDLYAHMHWADAGLWRSLLEHEGALQEERIRSLAYHVHLVQHAFLHVWKKEAYDVPKPETFGALTDIAAWGKSWHEEVPAFLASEAAGDLDATVDVPWAFQIKRMFKVDPAPVTLRDTMLQVVMHSQYHRGQLNTLLRALGGTPVHGDFISWVWLGRPAPEWPEL